MAHCSLILLGGALAFTFAACTESAGSKQAPVAKAGTGSANTKKGRKAIAKAVDRAVAKLRQDRAKSRPPSPSAKLPPLPPLPKPIVGAIPAYKGERPTAKLTSKELVAAIQAAHYDPERLGLRKLGLSLSYLDKKRNIKIEASGSWQSRSPAQVTISKLTRDGKILGKESKRHQQMHQALTFRLRRLLEGLGNGFLTHRLYSWADQPGKVAAVKGDTIKGAAVSLSMDVNNEFNAEKVVVTVDDKARVVHVKRTSSRGVVREMSYAYRMIDGRNLVSSATVKVSLANAPKLKGRMRVRLMSMDGMSFQFTYGKVGRFWLPKTIYRKSPKIGQEIALDLTYAAPATR